MKNANKQIFQHIAFSIKLEKKLGPQNFRRSSKINSEHSNGILETDVLSLERGQQEASGVGLEANFLLTQI